MEPGEMAGFNFTNHELGLSSRDYFCNLTQYDGKKEPDEILDFMWNNSNFDPKDAVPSGKDEDKAEHLRMLGNQSYREKKEFEALKFYNLSIMAAPHPVMNNEKIEEPEENMDEFAFPGIDPARYGGVELKKCRALGIAYANRSAVMLDVGHYDKCLQDIELALEYGYPEDMRHKLEKRRLKCQEEERKARMSGDRQAGTDAKNEQKNFLKKLLSPNIPKPPKLLDPNPCIPAFSKAVEVSHSPSKGRGLIATRAIKPGEVIGVERAYAVWLPKELLKKHCSTCTIECYSPLPCPGCDQVIFCSKSCRAKGLAEDHWLECKILASLIKCKIEQEALSYKMLKTFNFRQIQSMCTKLKKDKCVPPEKLGFNDKGEYISSSFRPVYHLHQDWTIFSKEEVMRLCMLAFIITKLLECSKRYFVDTLGKPIPVTKEDFMKTCKMIMGNDLRRAINSFKDFLAPLDGKGSTLTAGVKIFTAASLINHSCMPAIDHTTIGRVSFWYAVRPIAAGEELSATYTFRFHSNAKVYRKEVLKRAGVVCKCQACEGNWLTYPFLPETNLQNCSSGHTRVDMHCSDCRKLNSAIQVQNQILGKFISKKPLTKKDFKHICKSSEVAFKYSAMPCGLNVQLMNAIKSCGDEGLM